MGLGMIKKSSLCSAKFGQEDGILHRTTGSRWQARPARKDKTAFSKLIERRPQLVPELLAEARVDDNVDGGVAVAVRVVKDFGPASGGCGSPFSSHDDKGEIFMNILRFFYQC